MIASEERSSRPSFRIMGVVNVTPDSFSDGGKFIEPAAAADQIDRLITDGADLIDIGAESTRPGSVRVSHEDEWRRLAPVLEAALRKLPGNRISVDTRCAETMIRCADSGARFINCVGEPPSDAVLTQLARYQGMSFAAMHMHGSPQTMQNVPMADESTVAVVKTWFSETSARLVRAGFAAQQVWVDPGIGFGKSDVGNFRLLAATADFAKIHNVMVGVSRKSMLGRLLNIPKPADRDQASKGLEAGLVFAGARMIRTHTVGPLAKLRENLNQGN